MERVYLQHLVHSDTEMVELIGEAVRARAGGIAVRRFRDRAEAGRELGERLAEKYAGRQDVLVLALPRGGVVVGREVADSARRAARRPRRAEARLPGPERAGHGRHRERRRASAQRGSRSSQTGVSQALVDDVVARELVELERREALYRGDRPAPDVAGKTVLVVDDGLATGSTMLAAVQALRSLGAGTDRRRGADGAAADVRGARGCGRRGRLPTSARPVLRGRSVVRGLRRSRRRRGSAPARVDVERRPGPRLQPCRALREPGCRARTGTSPRGARRRGPPTPRSGSRRGGHGGRGDD